MKNLKLTSLLCGSVLSIAGSNAFAQQSPSSTHPSSSSSHPSSSSSATSPSSSASQYGTSDQSRSATSSSSLGASASAMNADNNVRLSQLMNSSVQSKDGKTLGNIRDLTIDPQSGRIEFAILSLSSAGAAADTSTSSTSGRETVPSNRSSNIGTPGATAGSTAMGKLIPVPWQLFSQSSSGSRAGTGVGASSAMGSHNLVLNIDESKLRTAPSFESSNWNELQTGNLDQRVYSFYGVDQSSATGTAGSSITGQGSQGSSTLPGRSSATPHGRSTSPQDHSTSPQGSTTSPQGSSTSPQE